MSNLIILGGGFAGVWAAMSAAAERKKLSGDDVTIALVSKDPYLTMRPRLYEGAKEEMRVPLKPLLDKIGVNFQVCEATAIDSQARKLRVADNHDLPFDRLVLATGSRLRRPPILGADTHAFSVDTFEDATRLDQHLEALPYDDEGTATFVVIGASFTGLEVATELRTRLGPDVRIVLVDQAETAGAELGANPHPHINEALTEGRIETRLGSRVAEIRADAVTLENGEILSTRTVILATGMEASPLTRFIPGARDAHGRLEVGSDLKVVGSDHIFAAGDTAHALADDEHVSLMSCQHAMELGRVVGRNALRDLLGRKTLPYRQEFYVTCLDLGPWGAAFTTGWDRQVRMTRSQGKEMKRQINTQWIYPPAGTSKEIFAAMQSPVVDPQALAEMLSA